MARGSLLKLPDAIFARRSATRLASTGGDLARSRTRPLTDDPARGDPLGDDPFGNDPAASAGAATLARGLIASGAPTARSGVVGSAGFRPFTGTCGIGLPFNPSTIIRLLPWLGATYPFPIAGRGWLNPRAVGDNVPPWACHENGEGGRGFNDGQRSSRPRRPWRESGLRLPDSSTGSGRPPHRCLRRQLRPSKQSPALHG